MKIGRFAFLRPPLGDLGATYDDHLGLTGKRVVDFLLVLIELSSLGVTAEELRANIGWKSAISLQRGSVDPKCQVEGVAPTNHSSSQKTGITDLSYDIKILPKISITWVGRTNVTDDRRQTDRQTDGRTTTYSEREREFTFAKNHSKRKFGILYLDSLLPGGMLFENPLTHCEPSHVNQGMSSKCEGW